MDIRDKSLRCKRFFRALRCKKRDRRVKPGVISQRNLTRKYLLVSRRARWIRELIFPDKIAISPKVDVGCIGAKGHQNRWRQEQVHFENLSHDQGHDIEPFRAESQGCRTGTGSEFEQCHGRIEKVQQKHRRGGGEEEGRDLWEATGTGTSR